MNTRRLPQSITVLLCAMAGVLALTGPSAQAAVTHHYLSQITEVPGSSGAPATGPLIGANAMIVDSGELYVAEGRGEYRLDRFTASSGAFVSQFPQVPSLSYLYQGVAVAHPSGDVYVGGDEFPEGSPEGVVAVFDSAGSLQKVWRGTHTAAGAFGCFECDGTADVAVDSSASLNWASGDVYVVDPLNAVVDVFKPEASGEEPAEVAAELTGTEPGVPFTKPVKVAVSAFNGEVFVVDEGAVDIFKPAALTGQYEFVGKLTGPPPNSSFSSLENVSIDGSGGDIYVAERHAVDQFSADGVFLGQFTGAATPAGDFNRVSSVAVDPAAPNHVFVGDSREHEGSTETGAVVDVYGSNIVVPDLTTGPPSNLKPKSATLNGTINPDKEGEASCQFVWGTSDEFGQVPATCEPEKVAEGESPVAVHAELSKLEPDTTYCYRLQATNKNETNLGEASQDECFTTPGPGLHSESVSGVKATSATLEATINPHNAPTTYYFQYGTTTGYGREAPALTPSEPHGAVAGFGEGDVEVAQHVQVGLSAGTVYHYRVVAFSEPNAGEFEEFDGPDQTFTTQTAGGGSTLPDGRQWEMVSPPDKHGANLLSFTEGYLDFQAATSGDAMTYVATAPTESQPQGFSNWMQVLSTRGPEGWDSRDIGVAHNKDTGATTFSENPFFSSDLSLGAVYPFGVFDPSVSTEASESTSYLRTDYLSENVSAPCVEACYRPLVTSKPGFANVPPGTVFGVQNEGLYGPEFLGATPDLSHIVLKSLAALTSTPVQRGLYEWAAGKLQLLSVLPEGGGAVEGSLGSIDERSARAGAISSDGSRVIWTNSRSALYLSDTATADTQTVRIDAVRSGTGAGEADPVFQVISSDGSKVFFTDTQRLTEDAGAVPGEPDLYECEMVEQEAGKLSCELSDVTPSIAGKRADFQGAVVGASAGAEWIYFVANGVLAAGAQPGQPNLYAYHSGATRLLAVLSGADFPDWLGESSDIRTMSARVSPNGRWLAFMSQLPLTGYDNRDAVGGQPDEEVFLYDAQSEHIVCASCNPTGSRPLGEVFGDESSHHQEEEFLGGNRAWGEQASFAGFLPGWTTHLYQSHYLSNSGRLFFDSDDALVPQDVNGAWDVYEYEPPGVGDCTTSTPTFGESSGGCVGLVSSGRSAEGSAFLDASETGGDVFFLSSAELAPQDYDTSVDVYDAHECTGPSPCLPALAAEPPPCSTGDACKPAPSPQPEIFGSGPSETFSGAGNITPPAVAKPKPKAGPTRCRKGFVNRKGKCAKTKSRKKKTKAKKAHNERRAKS